jgi:hypothetical protein
MEATSFPILSHFSFFPTFLRHFLLARNCSGLAARLLRHFRLFSESFLAGFPMFRSSTIAATGRPAGWGCVAALAACLGLSGCCSQCNLRGDKFADNPLADQGRQLRTPDRNNELFGLSNKAQQIEKDVGIQ